MLIGLELLQNDGPDWQPDVQKLTTCWITVNGTTAWVERSMEGLVLPLARGLRLARDRS